MIDFQEVGRCSAELLWGHSQCTVDKWRTTVTDVGKPSSRCIRRFKYYNDIDNVSVMAIGRCSHNRIVKEE